VTSPLPTMTRRRCAQAARAELELALRRLALVAPLVAWLVMRS